MSAPNQAGHMQSQGQSQSQSHGGPIGDLTGMISDFHQRILPPLEKILKRVAESDMLSNADKILKRFADGGVWGFLKK